MILVDLSTDMVIASVMSEEAMVRLHHSAG
jgi:hypothetical protein